MNPQTYRIALTAADIRMAERVGRKRGINLAAFDTYFGKKGEEIQSDPTAKDRTLMLAMCAEIAVCKFLATYPNLEIEHNPRYDLIHNGWEVDVKHADASWKNLLGKECHKKQPADIYVHVTGENPELMEIRGWAWGVDLFNDRNKDHLTDKKIPTWVMMPFELNDMTTLLYISHKEETNGTHQP
jgi:hypothetical protein